MVIDFKENIELLEKLIFNFVLMPDDNEIVIKPKNSEDIDKREVLAAVKPTTLTMILFRKFIEKLSDFS
jgi:hypothetical protein